MVLSVASYKQRMRGLELEVENKSANLFFTRARQGLEQVEATFSPLSFLPFSYSRPLREPKKKRVMPTWKGGRE